MGIPRVPEQMTQPLVYKEGGEKMHAGPISIAEREILMESTHEFHVSTDRRLGDGVCRTSGRVRSNPLEQRTLSRSSKLHLGGRQFAGLS